MIDIRDVGARQMKKDTLDEAVEILKEEGGKYFAVFFIYIIIFWRHKYI